MFCRGVPNQAPVTYPTRVCVCVCAQDSLTAIAQLPEIAAIVYRQTFHDGVVAPYDSSLDYSANFNRMLGFEGEGVDELMRM